MYNAPQKYPIGIQHFHKLREDNFLYIDKTEFVYKIAEKGGAYFLSRPRRFGKSLFVSTLRALYEGRKDLFQGLFIEDKWDFSQTNPVVYLPFNRYGFNGSSLKNILIQELHNQAEEWNVELKNISTEDTSVVGSLFQDLILKLHHKTGRKVVVLIDEYDKPIIDVLHDFEKADEHRAILKSFYGILKPADEHLQLVFLTGVSKFAKVSIFSDLNNLKDISISKEFAAITGITQEELENNFAQRIKEIHTEMNISFDELKAQIKRWYNGYTWDLKTKVYNPWSLLNFFDGKTFKNFWFETGTPTFLVEQAMLHDEYDFVHRESDSSNLNAFDFQHLDMLTLLFQTGYLTLESYDADYDSYILTYPNREVELSLTQNLLQGYRHKSESARPHVANICRALEVKDLDKVFLTINTIFSSLPYQLWENNARKEHFYHAIIHLTFAMVGAFVRSEICTSNGRCDAIVETKKYIYAFEFKLDGDAKAALQQVFDKGYLEPYRNSGKELIALGVNFTTERKGVSEWVVEIL